MFRLLKTKTNIKDGGKNALISSRSASDRTTVRDTEEVQPRATGIQQPMGKMSPYVILFVNFQTY